MKRRRMKRRIVKGAAEAERAARVAKMEPILSAVSKVFHVPAERIISRCNLRKICEARHALAALLQGTTWEVGGMMDRDHSNITKSRQAVRDLVDTDPRFKARFKELSERLKA